LFLLLLLLLLLLFFDFGGEDGRVAESLDLAGEFVGGGLDGHAGAVEGEGEEDVGAAEAVVGGGELEFGEGEGVAEVEVAVHVREGEVAEEFLAGRRGLLARFGSEDIFLFPPFLDLRFDLAETITPREALVAALARHVRVVAEAAV